MLSRLSVLKVVKLWKIRKCRDGRFSGEKSLALSLSWTGWEIREKCCWSEKEREWQSSHGAVKGEDEGNCDWGD